MKICDLDFWNVKLVKRDFSGSKFGPDYRTFSVEIADPEVQELLKRDKAPLWFIHSQNNTEPDKTFLNIRLDNRYNDVKVVVVRADGTAIKLNDSTFGDLDNLALRGADLHVSLSRNKRPDGTKGVTAYLKTMVAHVMSEEERRAEMEDRATQSDAVMQKYADLF